MFCSARFVLVIALLFGLATVVQAADAPAGRPEPARKSDKPVKPAAVKPAKPAKPAHKPQPTFNTPDEAGPDFLIQGEYVGKVQTDEGPVQFGVQVIALGDGRFEAVAHRGGLPGAGWDKSERIRIPGETKGGATTFSVPEHQVTGTIVGGAFVVKDESGATIGKLERIVRGSPTLGAKPPAGAVVLFDGTSADQFTNGQMSEDKLLIEGCTSTRTFQDHTIHLELRLPFMPFSRGQARANSGLYVQGRYEIQILDSFGLEGLDNECGGIYKASRPAVNMCLPPLLWQTYDVDFTAPKFKDGQKVANARITVRHNGVVIHENLELPNVTPGGPLKTEGPEPGPVFLQNHRNPVRFRNIWVVEK